MPSHQRAASCWALVQDQLREYVEEKVKGTGENKVVEKTVYRRLDITPVLLYLIASALLGDRYVRSVLSTVRYIHGGISAKETPPRPKLPTILAELERAEGVDWLEKARHDLGILD